MEKGLMRVVRLNQTVKLSKHKRKTVTKVEKEATTLLHCFVLHLTHINRGALQESLLNLSS